LPRGGLVAERRRRRWIGGSVSATGRSSSDGATDGPFDRPPPLRVLDTLRLLTTKPPPLEWIADGVWSPGKLTLFTGREKRGKSLVQLALALRMASGGGELAGIHVKPGRVLLIDGENGEAEIHRRLHALELAPEHADNLMIAEARGLDLAALTDSYLVESYAVRHRADLVLLDSFRALWRGDERDEAEIAAALDPIRAFAHDTGAAVSLTHHLPKGGEQTYRGSTAIGAAIEHVVVLERFEEDSQSKTRRKLSNPLARFAPQRPDRWLSICSEGDDGPTWLEAVEPYVPARETPAQDEVAVALLDQVRYSGNGHIPGTGLPDASDDAAPGWSLADLARAVGRHPDDQTVRRAVYRLAKDGVLYRGDGKRWYPAPRLFDDHEEDEP
jgi:AAA domain